MMIFPCFIMFFSMYSTLGRDGRLLFINFCYFCIHQSNNIYKYIINPLFNFVMKKVFLEPKLAIIKINSADIIATSKSTGGSTSGGAWGARRRDDLGDFDDFDDLD